MSRAQCEAEAPPSESPDPAPARGRGSHFGTENLNCFCTSLSRSAFSRVPSIQTSMSLVRQRYPRYATAYPNPQVSTLVPVEHPQKLEEVARKLDRSHKFGSVQSRLGALLETGTSSSAGYRTAPRGRSPKTEPVEVQFNTQRIRHDRFMIDLRSARSGSLLPSLLLLQKSRPPQQSTLLQPLRTPTDLLEVGKTWPLQALVHFNEWLCTSIRQWSLDCPHTVTMKMLCRHLQPLPVPSS